MGVVKRFKQMRNKYLLLMVFLSGMSIMAVEMSASRLLAPYYGTSLFVWTNIIGVIMIALSIGYYFGGKLADKYPKEELLYKIILGTSVFIALIPFIANPIMRLSVSAIDTRSISVLYTSLFATITLFALPLILLGMVSPFAIRVCSRKLEKVGNTAGSVYSLSTVGSIIGTFIPALITIPFIGTRKTIFLFAFILVLGSTIGLVKKNKKLLGIPIILLIPFFFTATIKPTSGLIFEDESVYHYIQVVNKNGVNYLKLNEGHAVHSVYDPNNVFVRGVWDYFSVLPLINNPKEVLIVGLAAGTISNAYSELYPEISIDGVEIDGKILDVGRKYFEMNEENLDVYATDGRIFLRSTDKKYDLIITDAYRQPYIPFHLTTKEYFQETKNHLNKGGICAINVGSTSSDSDVLKMIRNTMKSIYKYVYQVQINGSMNFVVIATDTYYDLSEIENYFINEYLDDLTEYVNNNFEEVEFDDDILVLTDDKAPVEIFTDKMIFEYGVS